jgi:hypothetical protein
VLGRQITTYHHKNKPIIVWNVIMDCIFSRDSLAQLKEQIKDMQILNTMAQDRIQWKDTVNTVSTFGLHKTWRISPVSSKTFKKDSPSWSCLCWVLTGPSSGSPLQASTSGVQNEGNHGSMPHMLVPPTWCERHICCSVTPIKMNVTLNYLCLKHMKLLKSNLLLTVSFNLLHIWLP